MTHGASARAAAFERFSGGTADAPLREIPSAVAMWRSHGRIEGARSDFS